MDEKQFSNWLTNAHRLLDETVAAAYSWENNISDIEVLSRLLAINRERTKGNLNGVCLWSTELGSPYIILDT